MLNKSFGTKVINTQDGSCPNFSRPFAIVSAVEVIGVCHTHVMGRLCNGVLALSQNSVFSVPCWWLEMGHGGSLYTRATDERNQGGLVSFCVRSIGCWTLTSPPLFPALKKRIAWPATQMGGTEAVRGSEFWDTQGPVHSAETEAWRELELHGSCGF